MIAPTTKTKVEVIAWRVLRSTLPGSPKSRADHKLRAMRIANVIWNRFHKTPMQWQLKHSHWYLRHHTKSMTPSSRYDQWRTLKALLVALGKFELWEHLLKGPWITPNGQACELQQKSRPAKLPGGPNAALRPKGKKKGLREGTYPKGATLKGLTQKSKVTNSNKKPLIFNIRFNVDEFIHLRIF